MVHLHSSWNDFMTLVISTYLYWVIKVSCASGTVAPQNCDFVRDVAADETETSAEGCQKFVELGICPQVAEKYKIYQKFYLY